MVSIEFFLFPTQRVWILYMVNGTRNEKNKIRMSFSLSHAHIKPLKCNKSSSCKQEELPHKLEDSRILSNHCCNREAGRLFSIFKCCISKSFY